MLWALKLYSFQRLECSLAGFVHSFCTVRVTSGYLCRPIGVDINLGPRAPRPTCCTKDNDNEGFVDFDYYLWIRVGRVEVET